jgi:ABC-type branched-subunit amino acid transport system substrate-binding protein
MTEPITGVRRLGLGVAAVSVLLTAACGTTVSTVESGTPAGLDSGLAAPGTASSTAGVPSVDSGVAGVAPGTTGLPSTTGATPATGSGLGVGPAAPGTVAQSSATGPVKVGILLTKVGNADAVGIKVGNTYSEQQFDDAIINALNKHGGLHGRKIIPVYANTNTASTDWSTDFQAACAKFTQDNRVDVVLGSDFAYFRSFEACLAKAGIPHLSSSSNVPDNQELGRFPLLRALIVPTIDKRSIAKLQGAINTGFLTPRNKLGVMTDSCPGTQRAWQDVVKPFLAQHHITVAATADEGCADGYNSSFSAAGAAVGNATLSFRSKGVDRITFITVSESGSMLVMSEDASSQHYYPGWILSSLAGTSLLQGQAPADEMKSTRVYGWLPSQDVTPSAYPKPNAAQQRCYRLLGSQGMKATSPADYSYTQSICEALFVYEKALGSTGGVSVGTTLIRGLGRVGTSFQSVFDLNGAADFDPSRLNDAPLRYREVRYQDSCGCFVYVGPTFPMP